MSDPKPKQTPAKPIRIGLLLKFVVLSGTVSWMPASQAISIDGYATEANDRFTNDGGFIAGSFDLSGVALNGRWLTMLSENVFISSNHYAPSSGSSVTFYASDDPAGASATRSVSANRTQIGSTDIFLGTLDSALPTGYASYQIATQAITTTTGNGPSSFGNSIYSGANAYAFGRSPAAFVTSQDMAVGRNELDRFVINQTVENFSGGSETGDSIGATVDNPGVPFEAALASGDSGAPLFVDDGNGALTLVGINWFIGTSGSDDIFGTTYLGNHSDDIQIWVEANTIPEPSAFAFAIGLCGLYWAVRRRRS